MAAPEARDQTIVAALLTELAKIGNAPATDWLTSPPDPAEGVPGDAIPQSPDLQLYLEHVQTTDTPADDTASAVGPAHGRTLLARVWCFAKVTSDNASRGRKKVRQLAADCVRALQAAEGAFQELTQAQGVVCGAFSTQLELVPTGFAGGVLEVRVTYRQEHGAP